MFRHTAEHLASMGANKKACIAPAIERLDSCAKEGRFDSELVSTVIKDNPQYADTILLIYSGLLSEAGYNFQANRCLEKICRLYESDKLRNSGVYKARVFLTYGLSFVDHSADNSQKNIDLALINIRKAIKFNPDYKEAKLSLAMMLADGKRFAEARNQFEEVLAQYPDYLEGYHNYSLFLQERGEKENAMLIRERLLEKFPDCVKALRLYAVDVVSILEDYHEAIRIYQKILGLLGSGPFNEEQKIFKAKIHLGLGIAYTEIVDRKNAREAYEEAEKLWPLAATKSARAHSKQLEVSRKFHGKLGQKLGREFNFAMYLDRARFDRNHDGVISQPSPTVSVREPKSSTPQKQTIRKFATYFTPPEKRKVVGATLSVATSAAVRSSFSSKDKSVAEPIIKKTPHGECLELFAKISKRLQGHEQELPKELFDELQKANERFEKGSYEKAKEELLNILPRFETQIKRIESKKQLAKIVPKLDLSVIPQFEEHEPKPAKHRRHKKNPATLFAQPSQSATGLVSIDTLRTLLPVALLPIAAIVLLYVFYQLGSSIEPEQAPRFIR